MKDLVTLQCDVKRKSRSNNTSCQQKQKTDKFNGIILFDIESLKVNVGQTSSGENIAKWIPHQIAWAVYDSKLESICEKNYYVAEMWVNSNYRRQISAQFKDSFKLHHQKVLSNNYPVKSASKIINKMLKCIQKYNVNIIASYNIHSDFVSLKNLVNDVISDKTNINNSQFNCKYSNPFRMNIDYCDLMHNVGVFYIDYLIDEGLKDEKIFRDAGSRHRIKLTGRDASKGVYSAEYVLSKFFDLKQSHFAEEDVDFEMKLFRKMVDDFGLKDLELNVMYPDNLYNKFRDKILKEHSEKVKSAYMYAKTTN